MSSSSNSTPSTIVPSLTNLHTATTIPDSLEFLIKSLKVIVSIILTPKNYLLWKSQATKLFTANNYFGYLDGSIPQSSPFVTTADNLLSPNPDTSFWILIENNLSTALLSTISLPILPHLQDLPTYHDIWTAIHHRLQPTNCSHLTQLRQQLYTLSMKDQSMEAYLSTIKSHVDAITAAGSHLEPDEIIHYILNFLPSSYQSFKTAIRANLQPLNLDDFYSLLCNKEDNLALDTHRELLNTTPHPPQPALNTQLTDHRGRPQYSKP